MTALMRTLIAEVAACCNTEDCNSVERIGLESNVQIYVQQVEFIAQCCIIKNDTHAFFVDVWTDCTNQKIPAHDVLWNLNGYVSSKKPSVCGMEMKQC